MLSPRAQNAGLFGRLRRRQQHFVRDAVVVGLGLGDVAEERHLASPGGGRPEWVAFDHLFAEHHMIELAGYRRVEASQIVDHGLHPSQRPPALVIHQFAVDTRHDKRHEGQRRTLFRIPNSLRFLFVVLGDVVGQ